MMMLLQDSDSYSASLSSLCSDSVSSSSVSVSFDMENGDTADSSCSSESQPQSEGRVSPLSDLGSLRKSLPFKKGLSMFFGGKSQSFTSFTDIKCADELAKPENPYNEYYRLRNRKRVKKTKFKGCRSCGSSLLSVRSASSSSMISKAPHKRSIIKSRPKRTPALPRDAVSRPALSHLPLQNTYYKQPCEGLLYIGGR